MNESKKKLLFLHGALGSEAHFDQLVSLLQNDYDCYRLDFCGHGKAAFTEAFGIESFAQQTNEFIEKNGLNGCGVFGYSMGGYVALFLEAQHPGTFEKILTLGTKFNWNPETSVKEAAFLNPDAILQKVPKYAEQLEKMHGDKWAELCRRSAAMMVALGEKPALDETKLKSITIPVRISLGDKDRMVSLEESVHAYRNLSHGSFLVMPATPHPIDQVDVERLAYKIRSFF